MTESSMRDATTSDYSYRVSLFLVCNGLSLER